MLNARDRRRQETTAEVCRLLEITGSEQAANAMGLTWITVRRWARGEIQPSIASLAMLRQLAGRGFPGWPGWRFVDEVLVSPEGYKYTPGDLLAQTYQRPLIKALRAELDELRGMVAALAREASQRDPAANDMAIYPEDPRTQAYEAGATRTEIARSR